MVRDLKVKVEINLIERKVNATRPNTDWDQHDKEREALLKYLIKNIF